MREHAPSMERLRGIDILALFFASVCLFEAVVEIRMQPTYLAMFKEFGAELPLFTRLMLNPGVVMLAGLLPVLFVAEGVLRRRSEASQVVRCVVAIIAAISLVAGFIGALYLPIVRMNGVIAP